MALIPNKNALQQFNYIFEAPGDTSYVKNFIKKFVDTPIASLETLTFKICKKNGTAINFGQDMLPFNHEYCFSSDQGDFTPPIDGYAPSPATLIINTPKHGLGLYVVGTSDSVRLYNVKLIDETKYPPTTTELRELNNIYTVAVYTASQDQFTINLPIITSVSPLPAKFTIKGNWKRVCNENGWYSRNKIDSATIVDNFIEIVTTDNHYLNKYDRIFISSNSATESTAFLNNHHIVTSIEGVGGKTFRISRSNIAIDDITINLSDDIDTNDDNLIDDPSGPTAPFGYIQRYGEYDQTIQNQMIISITCRDEDDSNVRSDNISYGTNF